MQKKLTINLSQAKIELQDLKTLASAIPSGPQGLTIIMQRLFITPLNCEILRIIFEPLRRSRWVASFIKFDLSENIISKEGICYISNTLSSKKCPFSLSIHIDIAPEKLEAASLLQRKKSIIDAKNARAVEQEMLAEVVPNLAIFKFLIEACQVTTLNIKVISLLILDYLSPKATQNLPLIDILELTPENRKSYGWGLTQLGIFQRPGTQTTITDKQWLQLLTANLQAQDGFDGVVDVLKEKHPYSQLKIVFKSVKEAQNCYALLKKAKDRQGKILRPIIQKDYILLEKGNIHTFITWFGKMGAADIAPLY